MSTYACHITIEPVFEDRLDLVKRIAEAWKFKVASLLMVKSDGTTEPSRRDTFMTSHSPVYGVIEQRLQQCVVDLKGAGFTVLRYKIELIILDSRYQKDPLYLLPSEILQAPDITQIQEPPPQKLIGCKACFGSGGKRIDPCLVCNGTGKVPK